MAKAGIVYVGTDNGIITLSDPGATGRWRQIGHALQGEPVQAILSDTALSLVVRTPQGYQRSMDGGQSWTLTSLPAIPAEPVVAVQLDGSPPAEVRASAAADGRRGLERSSDAGATWQPVVLPEGVLPDVTVLVAAQYHRDVVWAGTAGGEVLVSNDRGRTWDLVKDGLAPVRSLAAVRLI